MAWPRCETVVVISLISYLLLFYYWVLPEMSKYDYNRRKAMLPTMHVIDPNGDTLLILCNADQPFAPPYNILLDDDDDVPKSPLGGLTLEDPAWDDEPCVLVNQQVRMKLSSKHLTLASAYFQKLMAHDWAETRPENGYAYTISAEEWDADALLVLMKILHGRTAHLPRIISLEMLAKIAVLVDYYQCHEAVKFYSDTWTSNLQEPFPPDDNRDRLLWLLVSWVFPNKLTFKTLTKAMICESTGPIQSLGLPIPDNVISELPPKELAHTWWMKATNIFVESIEQKRLHVLSETLASLKALQERLLVGEGFCSYECSAALLGCLMKGMKTRAIDLSIESPFHGYSVAGMERSIHNLKEPSVGIMRKVCNPEWIFQCSLCEYTQPIVKDQLGQVEGLDLSEFREA